MAPRGGTSAIADGRGHYRWPPPDGFAYFRRFRPLGHAGWSIYIYRITPEECAAARRDMGLPE